MEPSLNIRRNVIVGGVYKWRERHVWPLRLSYNRFTPRGSWIMSLAASPLNPPWAPHFPPGTAVSWQALRLSTTPHPRVYSWGPSTQWQSGWCWACLRSHWFPLGPQGARIILIRTKTGAGGQASSSVLTRTRSAEATCYCNRQQRHLSHTSHEDGQSCD